MRFEHGSKTTGKSPVPSGRVLLPAPDGAVIVVDSATELPADAAGRVVVCGSHGGRFPAGEVLAAGVRAVVLHDAGIGREGAGIAGLEVLGLAGVPAATVGAGSARIGDGHDIAERGRLTHVNALAAGLGCRVGMAVPDAVVLLDQHPGTRSTTRIDDHSGGRTLLRDGSVRVWALDSASLVRRADAGDVVVTGSHGGLLGGRPETALKVDVAAAVFNDAGGSDCTRLEALDRRAIPAAAVACSSALIGDGLSTWNDGIISALNTCAIGLGASEGGRVPAFVDLVLDTARRGGASRPEGDEP